MAALVAACMVATYLLVGSGHTSQTAGGSVAPAGWGKPAPISKTLRLTLTPTAAMYDSVNLAEIPAKPYAAAGYVAGNWRTFPTIRSTWPSTHAISIAVQADEHAECLDVEPGDATPAQAAGWVKADIAAGYKKPCVYSSWWEYTNEVIPDLKAAGIARSSIYEWDANYTNVPHLDAGFDATQWTKNALGRNLDESEVTYPFLEAASPPYVPPAPKPKPKPKPAPPPPAPSPTSKAVCFGKGATPNGKTCKIVIARHTWLVDRRIFWGRAFQTCIRHADGILCARAEHWYLLRRSQAVQLHNRYSA